MKLTIQITWAQLHVCKIIIGIEKDFQIHLTKKNPHLMFHCCHAFARRFVTCIWLD